MANANLHKAKAAKNDEFYTQFSDVQNELWYYRDHFHGKTIFCNCDDPTSSAFWEYFHLNFEFFGLKKLISTHYDPVNPTYKLVYEGGDDNDKEVGTKIPLQGNGDFRNEECIELLKESDIVVTNPPFSLFREYLAQLTEYNKKFVIIGNKNAITYKEVFPLIKENKLWLGHLNPKTFIKPNGETQTFGNVGWFTNLDIQKRHEELILWRRYYAEDGVTPLPTSAEMFPKYDNYDAINVDKVADIPVDYNGVMGVPITFLDKYNPEQFEIVDANHIRLDPTRTKAKAHGLIKDADASITVCRERESYLCACRNSTSCWLPVAMVGIFMGSESTLVFSFVKLIKEVKLPVAAKKNMEKFENEYEPRIEPRSSSPLDESIVEDVDSNTDGVLTVEKKPSSSSWLIIILIAIAAAFAVVFLSLSDFCTNMDGIDEIFTENAEVQIKERGKVEALYYASELHDEWFVGEYVSDFDGAYTYNALDDTTGIKFHIKVDTLSATSEDDWVISDDYSACLLEDFSHKYDNDLGFAALTSTDTYGMSETNFESFIVTEKDAEWSVKHIQKFCKYLVDNGYTDNWQLTVVQNDEYANHIAYTDVVIQYDEEAKAYNFDTSPFDLVAHRSES